jgi:hypothetical protein
VGGGLGGRSRVGRRVLDRVVDRGFGVHVVDLADVVAGAAGAQRCEQQVDPGRVAVRVAEPAFR